jgi:hypothetical protein
MYMHGGIATVDANNMLCNTAEVQRQVCTARFAEIVSRLRMNMLTPVCRHAVLSFKTIQHKIGCPQSIQCLVCKPEAWTKNAW